MVTRPCVVAPLVAALLLAAGAPARAKPSCGTGGPTGEGSGAAGAGTYRYRVPAGYSAAKPIPLLLALHGDEGTPDYIYSAFRGLQDTSGGAYLLVAPKAPFGGGSWYQATTQHTDFINQLISQLLSSYNIDQDRIWITGWSGGATFLGYYAIVRQDILAAVVYHMGGGGGGSYSPPASSCKIYGRFVIGSQDFLYDLAQKQYNTMKAEGHEVLWIELPGVGHDFQSSTLPATWSWLQSKTLCGTTTPGGCGPDAGTPPKPDLGPAPPVHDGGTPAPSPASELGPSTADGGPAPLPDSGGGKDNLSVHRGRDTDLLGGCTVGPARGTGRAWGTSLLLLAVLGMGMGRRRRFR